MRRPRWCAAPPPAVRSNATELMLRSGRVGPGVPAAGRADPNDADDADQLVAALDQVGRRLSVAMVALAPFRSASEDALLGRAHRAVHDAVSDLAVVLIRVSGLPPPARRARRGRRRRPWGARS